MFVWGVVVEAVGFWAILTHLGCMWQRGTGEGQLDRWRGAADKTPRHWLTNWAVLRASCIGTVSHKLQR